MEPSVESALRWAMGVLAGAGVETPRLDAQLLLAWTLKARREDLAREPERAISAREQSIFEKAVSLRAGRRPLPYITGERVFYGRSFKINRAVLIPRPETEILVEAALARLPAGRAVTAADIGVGSACIAVTLACERPDAVLYGVDLSPNALTLARRNVARHGALGRIHLFLGDLLTPLPDDLEFDAIVSNPPYVTAAQLADLEPEVRDFEPKPALVGACGADGTGLHRRLIPASSSRLRPGGWLLMEVGRGQAEKVETLARQFGYHEVERIADLAGIDRVVAAQWK